MKRPAMIRPASLVRIVALLAALLVLSGCDEHYVHSHHTTVVTDPRPLLDRFHMVDSYETDTGLGRYYDLSLNPYIWDGLFEVYWYASYARDYYAEVWINDRPSLRGARFIDDFYCGDGLNCDSYGSTLCQYTEDFFLSCSVANAGVDIGDLVYTLPQAMYLMVQVCDTGSTYCEYQHREVWLE